MGPAENQELWIGYTKSGSYIEEKKEKRQTTIAKKKK